MLERTAFRPEQQGAYTGAMRLFCANIKSNPLMRQSRVESDIGHAILLGGVGFWQEIAPKRYKAALARHAEAVGAAVWGVAVECPLTLRVANWRVESHTIYKMHSGRLFVTPSRYVLEARCHEKFLEHLKVAFFSTHFLSAAFSNNHRLTKAWRRAMWELHRGKLRKLIAAAHAAGYTCIIGGDFNHGVDTMGLHPDSVVLSAHGVLGIIAVPAPGTRITGADERVIRGLFTDHDPSAVTATVRPQSR